jgi:hypothetical protein
MAVHELVSMLAFVGGGLAALLTIRFQVPALRPLQVLLGGASLGVLGGYLVLGDVGVFQRLGEGGVERWVVYPVVLWLLLLGSSLAARTPADRSPTG